MNTALAIGIYVVSGLCIISFLVNKIIPAIPLIKELVKHPIKSFFKFIHSLFSLLVKRKKYYNHLCDKCYFEQFKFNSIKDSSLDKYILVLSKKEKKLLREAYKKAWECRNFEIDKFWSRSAYFWGFIALIFTGYVVFATNDTTDTVIKNVRYLDLYLILSGFLFSIGWLLVILGSKAWQENWENHIDHLEDLISGPLYKTVFCSTRPHYYSVSKINAVMAIITIIVWSGLLIQFLLEYKPCLPFFEPDWEKKIIWHISVALLIATVFFFVLIFGYPISGYNLSRDSLKKLNEQKLKGAFVRRDETRSTP